MYITALLPCLCPLCLFLHLILLFLSNLQKVYILYGNSIKFVEIVPLYSSNNYVICDPDPDTSELMTSETLTLYDEVVVGGKDLYDGKMVK